MKAEIISIGTELLLGTITDTNASYLGQRLAGLGIDCYHISQVGDNLGRLAAAIHDAWERNDLVITTGGLGPTQDDLTREAIAQVLGEEMKVDPRLERELRSNFARRGAEMPESNLKQATLIPSATPILNPVGTAPGWWVRRQTATGLRQIVSMPGVPFEMRRMWELEVEPDLRTRSGHVILSRTLKVLGYGESAVEARVQDLMGGANPTLAPYAKRDGIHLRITAKTEDPARAQEMIAGLEKQVRERLGRAIYGVDDETPWGVTLNLASKLGVRLVLLEIGREAVGALTPLLHEAGTKESTGKVLGIVSVPDIDDLAPLFARKLEASNLQQVLEALFGQTAADVALGVRVQAREDTAQPAGAVVLGAEISLVFLGDREPDRRSRSANSTWKTAPGEIGRLVGLAACNMLRKELLDLESRVEQ